MAHSIDRLNVALEGRYTIEGELGEGGMATVYLAQDLRHGRRVALTEASRLARMVDLARERDLLSPERAS